MSMEAPGGGARVGTSDRSGGNNVGDECHIEVDQRFSEQEKEQFVSFEEASKVVHETGNNAKPKIQKVPSMLRDNDKFKKYFVPKVFSFGPHCHLYRTEKMAMQIKVNLAAKFLESNGVKKEDLYEVIREQIKELKDCYDDDLTKDYKDHKLAWMFLVDGCAILEFMYNFIDSREDPKPQLKILGIKTDYAEFLAHDLFLLENQLPYRLLQLIIQHSWSKLEPHQKEIELLYLINEFIFYYIRTPQENRKVILKDDLVHLLDLLREKFIYRRHPRFPLIDCDPINLIWSLIVVLFDKLKRNRNERVRDRVALKRNRNECVRDRVAVPFRNIGKLREAGINLKPNKSRSVSDISFSGGTLRLPPITMDESTATMLLNMLGYEMCHDFHKGSEVSSYMYFMDKLIDRTQDVEELREKNILLNELGSDEEVVKLFNGIITHMFPDSKYYKVKSEIDNYFDNEGLIWLRKVSHDIHQYFKGRWSLLAFIGALVALASSIIQTVFTVLAYQADSKKGI